MAAFDACAAFSFSLSFSFSFSFSLSLPFFFGGSAAFDGLGGCAGTAFVTMGLALFEATVDRLARRSSNALLPQLAVAGKPGASCIELDVSVLSCRCIGIAAATAGPWWAGGAARDVDDCDGCCVWIEFIMERSWRVKLSLSSPGSCKNMQLRLLQVSPRRYAEQYFVVPN